MRTYWGESEKEAVLRETQFRASEIETRIEDAEIRLAETLTPTGNQSVVTPVEPSIVNLLRNTDLAHSVNSFWEAVTGTGKSAHEIAYFFSHPAGSSVLSFTNALTNPGDNVTTAIKSSEHPNFSENISNPKWRREYGTILFGKTNTIDLPFGSFSAAGINFVDVHPLRAGDPLFLTFKIARKSQFVRPKGRLYAGIYNSKAGFEGWIKGANYKLAAARRGAGIPATQVTAQYMIAIEIDQGYTLTSEVVTINDSPDLASMNISSYNFLSWSYIAGTLRTRIFRKFGLGNVFEINENPQGQNTYVDKGSVGASDTGSTSFPVLSNQKSAIESFWASSEIEFQQMFVDGEDSQWSLFMVWLAVPSSVQMNNVEKPALRIGATASAGIRVTDAVADSSNIITSVAAQFTAKMDGKNFLLRNPASGATHSGTVSFISSNVLQLSASTPFSAANCVLEVEDCVEDAYEIDKIGVGFARGLWSPHPEDTSGRPQPQSSQPPQSSQGDGAIGQGDDAPIYGGGYGGSFCVLSETSIHICGADGAPVINKADWVKAGDFAWFGTKNKNGKYFYNEIEEVTSHYVPKIIEIKTSCGSLRATDSHRMITDNVNLKDGTPLGEIAVGDIVFRFDEKTLKFIAEEISSREIIEGNFKVVSFKMRSNEAKTAHLFMCSNYLSHNLKDSSRYRDYMEMQY